MGNDKNGDELAELERRLWAAADQLAKNTNLRRTRDLLLPKLISGEVVVEDIETRTEG